jgi:hypothetical protein
MLVTALLLVLALADAVTAGWSDRNDRDHRKIPPARPDCLWIGR